MDVDQLIDGLSHDDADPRAVISQLRRKHHVRRRNRLVIGTGCLLAAVLVAAGTALAWPQTHPNVESAGSASVHRPPVALTDGCGGRSLAMVLAAAKSAHASVFLAKGTLTGITTPDHVGGPGTALSGTLLTQMRLGSVRMLAGPRIDNGSAGWLSNGDGPNGSIDPHGPVLGGDAGALWAPDGGLFGILWPLAKTGGTVGPMLRIAPVVGDQVILSAAGCWSAIGLPGVTWKGQLNEIPGSGSYARASASRLGFTAVPLATIRTMTAA